MTKAPPPHDFKGIGYSKIGYFKETRSKIRELEKLNVELSRRHNRLETIFNSMSDGVTILDRKLNIVYANQVQKEMFPDSSLGGKKCYATYYGRKAVCKDCPGHRTLHKGETLQGEVLVKSGRYAGRCYEWTTSPIRGTSGNVAEIMLLMRDITTRKEYEHKLMQADRMAAIGFLAAGIAHEINNPLTSIAGFSEGLIKRLKKISRHPDDALLKSFREYLDIIHHEAYRCKDIIRNLQEFSRDSGDDYEIIAINDIITNTMSLFRQHAKDYRMKMNFLDHTSPGRQTIYGKESQLKHLFLNLFNRAFKSMDKGGEFTVASTSQGNHIQISLTDTGSCNTHLPDRGAFEPGSRMDATIEGNPVDLSICYSIVQHHKGEIQFSADDKNGGIIRLTFPVNRP